MSAGGQFYREKFKPPTIQYIEEHFTEFKNFMENMSPEFVEFVKNITENYVTYVTGMTSSAAAYFEQTTPIIMNSRRTVTTVATPAIFIPSGQPAGVPVGLISAEVTDINKAFLLIIGSVMNTFAGANDLDCTVATDNQWQMNIDNGAYSDLQNDAKADGQMLDGDWPCVVQGTVIPFAYMFDITGSLTSLTSRIGLMLNNARSRQNNLVVSVDMYLKVVWKL